MSLPGSSNKVHPDPVSTPNVPITSGPEERSAWRKIANSIEGIALRVIGQKWEADHIDQRIERPPLKIIRLSKEAKETIRTKEPAKEETAVEEGTQGKGALRAVSKVAKSIANKGKKALESELGIYWHKNRSPFLTLRDIYEKSEGIKTSSSEVENQSEEALSLWESFQNLLKRLWEYLADEDDLTFGMQLKANEGSCYGHALQKAGEELGATGSIHGNDQIIALQLMQGVSLGLQSGGLGTGNAEEAVKFVDELKEQEKKVLGCDIKKRDPVATKKFMKGDFWGDGMFFSKDHSNKRYVLGLRGALEGHAISINLDNNSLYDVNTGTHKFIDKVALKEALEEKIEEGSYTTVQIMTITKSK